MKKRKNKRELFDLIIEDYFNDDRKLFNKTIPKMELYSAIRNNFESLSLRDKKNILEKEGLYLKEDGIYRKDSKGNFYKTTEVNDNIVLNLILKFARV